MKIAVNGASGRLGAMICNLAHDAVPVERSKEAPAVPVVIDVSSAEGLRQLIPKLKQQALLVGTTGDLPWEALEDYAKNAPVAVVPNFSVGIPMLIELISKAVPALPPGWDIEIVEAHHNQKKDAPSGTALRLAKAVAQCSDGILPNMHSLRAGDTFGEHTIWMCGPGERIELKHVATGRSVFAIGALRWAKWLVKQPNGLIRP